MSTRKKEIPRDKLEANRHIYSEYFDPGYAEAFVRHPLGILMDGYFRTRCIGFEEGPEPRNHPDHPVIYISNHSGMCFPWDGMIFMGWTLRMHGYDINKVPRPIIAPQLSRIRLMNPFMIKGVWKRCGGVDATYLNYETMMHYPHSNVLVFPEGVPGIGKGFNKKYKLQRFATSTIRMALKYRTDIVPFLTINGEYLNPYTYSAGWVNRLFTKIGIPFMPLGLQTPLLLLLPWMFYYGMPARITYVKCRRIPVDELSEKAYADISEAEILAIRDRVQREVQQQMDEAVERYGKRPFEWSGFWAAVGKNRQYLPFIFPFFWPMLFEEFERQWRRKKRTGQDIRLYFGWGATLSYIIRNPITMAYFIPILGWIPILLKGYMKNE